MDGGCYMMPCQMSMRSAEGSPSAVSFLYGNHSLVRCLVTFVAIPRPERTSAVITSIISGVGGTSV